MPVISVGIPEELKKEIEEFMREEGPEESAVLRKLLNMAISEMNVWDFAEMVKEKKIILHLLRNIDRKKEIPRTVFEEVVTKDKEYGKVDALIVDWLSREFFRL